MTWDPTHIGPTWWDVIFVIGMIILIVTPPIYESRIYKAMLALVALLLLMVIYHGYIKERPMPQPDKTPSEIREKLGMREKFSMPLLITNQQLRESVKHFKPPSEWYTDEHDETELMGGPNATFLPKEDWVKMGNDIPIVLSQEEADMVRAYRRFKATTTVRGKPFSWMPPEPTQEIVYPEGPSLIIDPRDVSHGSQPIEDRPNKNSNIKEKVRN